LESFDLLPQGLIKARIARGLSQKDLAEKVGLAEQQIQRYEADEYATASFERLKEIISALNIKVKEEIFLTSSSFNESQLFKNLAQLGISKEFILQKLMPQQLANKLQNIGNLQDNEAENILGKITSIISKVFKFNIDDLLSGSLSFNTDKVYSVRYKKSSAANPIKVTAYTIYAHLLAISLYQSSKIKTQKPIPEDPFEVRRNIIDGYGKLNFENVINYIWDLGIPVIALNDSGAFHGACWRIEGFNVIALKQKTMSEARWIFDALHELCHSGQQPDHETFEIIEKEDIASSISQQEDEEEANYFAHDIILGENADDLAEKCIIAAKGNMSNLKTEVIKVSQKNKIDTGALANYIAFRLSNEQGHNWWGTANNLQTLEFTPWEFCRKLIFKNCNLDVLDDFNKEILVKALI
jgi:transcriptional regulator with XRE-family HTH domain